MTILKKILFIIPPYFNACNNLSAEISACQPVFTIPYGVLSIESYLKGNFGKQVKIELLDLNLIAYRISKKDSGVLKNLESIIRRKMHDFKPEIVAISALFNTSYGYLSMISSSVKQSALPPLVVIGGGLATNLPENILKNFPDIDAACYGEGEIPMKDLVDADDYSLFFKEHPSWLTIKDIESGKISTPSYVKDLDDIPIFKYDLINLDDYNGRSLDKQYCSVNNKRELSIHTSRGCPFKCVFCANGRVHGRKVRFMSVDRVILEVETMKHRHGLTVLLIEDDHFLANKKRAKEILAKLAELEIRIEFPNGIAVYAIDEEIGALLKRAGATTVALAVESGSDYVLREIINKPLTSNMIDRAVRILKKSGLIVHAFIVVGLPGEMDEHRAETMKMIEEVGFDWVYFFIAIPIVGSRLYDMCIANDYLVNDDFQNHLVSKANIRAPGVDPERLEEAVYLMNLKVNFINNHNMKVGNFEKAAFYFKNVAEKYPCHAIAHFCLSKALEQSEDKRAEAEEHMKEFERLVNTNTDLYRYVEELLPSCILNGICSGEVPDRMVKNDPKTTGALLQTEEKVQGRSTSRNS